MTPERWVQVRAILYSVVELAPDQRAHHLDQVCATDPLLREEVESYVLSHAEIDHDFLKTIATDDFIHDSAELRPSLVGHLVGSYKIVNEIGSGGMGDVY